MGQHPELLEGFRDLEGDGWPPYVASDEAGAVRVEAEVAEVLAGEPFVAAGEGAPLPWDGSATEVEGEVRVIADDLDRLVTARFPLSRVQEALTLVTSRPTYRVFVEYGPA